MPGERRIDHSASRAGICGAAAMKPLITTQATTTAPMPTAKAALSAIRVARARGDEALRGAGAGFGGRANGGGGGVVVTLSGTVGAGG